MPKVDDETTKYAFCFFEEEELRRNARESTQTLDCCHLTSVQQVIPVSSPPSPGHRPDQKSQKPHWPPGEFPSLTPSMVQGFYLLRSARWARPTEGSSGSGRHPSNARPRVQGPRGARSSDQPAQLGFPHRESQRFAGVKRSVLPGGDGAFLYICVLASTTGASGLSLRQCFDQVSSPYPLLLFERLYCGCWSLLWQRFERGLTDELEDM